MTTALTSTRSLLDKMATAEAKAPTGRRVIAAQLVKSDDEKRIGYYWLSVVETKEGKLLQDSYGHVIKESAMEDGSHFFMKHHRKVGFRHMDANGQRTGSDNVVKVGTVTASMPLTKELAAALGIPAGTLPVGWLVGVSFEDEDVWQAAKAGLLPEASLGGDGAMEEVDIPEDMLTTTA